MRRASRARAASAGDDQGGAVAARSSWQSLPNDVLLALFRLLCVPDRLRAACVCRAWAAACRQPSAWERVVLSDPFAPAGGRCAARAALLLAAVRRAGASLQELDARPWPLAREEPRAEGEEARLCPVAALANVLRAAAAAAPAGLRTVAINADTGVDGPVWSMPGSWDHNRVTCVAYYPLGPDGRRFPGSGKAHIYERFSLTCRPLEPSLLHSIYSLRDLVATLRQGGCSAALRCDVSLDFPRDVKHLRRLAHSEDVRLQVEQLHLNTHDWRGLRTDSDDSEERPGRRTHFCDALPALLAAPGVRTALKHLVVDGLHDPEVDEFEAPDAARDQSRVQAVFSAALAAPLLATLRVYARRTAGVQRLLALEAALRAAPGPLHSLRHVTLTLALTRYGDSLPALAACRSAVQALRDVAPHVQHLFVDVCFGRGNHAHRREQQGAAVDILRAALAAPAWPGLRHLQLCVELWQGQSALAEQLAADVDALQAQAGPSVRMRFAAFRFGRRENSAGRG